MRNHREDFSFYFVNFMRIVRENELSIRQTLTDIIFHAIKMKLISLLCFVFFNFIILTGIIIIFVYCD